MFQDRLIIFLNTKRNTKPELSENSTRPCGVAAASLLVVGEEPCWVLSWPSTDSREPPKLLPDSWSESSTFSAGTRAPAALTQGPVTGTEVPTPSRPVRSSSEETEPQEPPGSATVTAATPHHTATGMWQYISRTHSTVTRRQQHTRGVSETHSSGIPRGLPTRLHAFTLRVIHTQSPMSASEKVRERTTTRGMTRLETQQPHPTERPSPVKVTSCYYEREDGRTEREREKH